MAHIFKYPSENNNGIVVISHQEADRFMSEHSDLMHDIKAKNYFVGVHYGGFSVGVNYPPFADFFMGRRYVTNIAQRYPNAFEIPVVSSNFTSTVFKSDPEVKKYWDIINVSRAGKVKRLDLFLNEVRKIYDKGYSYKILLVCPKRHEETNEDHFTNIEDVYYNTFNKEERQNFTLMRLDENLEFKGLSKTQLSFFYQASKVSTLFSTCEGSPGVIAESLLCKVPVVVYAHQIGSGRDFLNQNNSVYWEQDTSAHEALINAVENYDKFEFDEEEMKSAYREDKGLEKLEHYFTELYNKHGQQFDGELTNTDDLVSRLPSHYTELPWVNTRLYNGHMVERSQFERFVEAL